MRKSVTLLHWLLPLLAAYLLLPPGVMPGPVAGGSALVLCAPALAGAAGAAGHGGPCPFAASPSAAPVPAMVLSVVPLPLPRPVEQRIERIVAERHAMPWPAPRGPPRAVSAPVVILFSSSSNA